MVAAAARCSSTPRGVSKRGIPGISVLYFTSMEARFEELEPGLVGDRHEVARRYGFVEWDGPILEPTELYTKKSGPEIVAQLFNFTDKGEREVAMRPEMTSVAACETEV